jgi:hypothetical protein
MVAATQKTEEAQEGAYVKTMTQALRTTSDADLVELRARLRARNQYTRRADGTITSQWTQTHECSQENEQPRSELLERRLVLCLVALSTAGSGSVVER